MNSHQKERSLQVGRWVGALKLLVASNYAGDVCRLSLSLALSLSLSLSLSPFFVQFALISDRLFCIARCNWHDVFLAAFNHVFHFPPFVRFSYFHILFFASYVRCWLRACFWFSALYFGKSGDHLFQSSMNACCQKSMIVLATSMIVCRSWE